jgi:CobQ-like glutamine amidotransferase family enzyme
MIAATNKISSMHLLWPIREVKLTACVTIALVYPDLLSTYGDRGNGIVLQRRAEWRGIDAKTIVVRSHDNVPAGADIYLIGGGEDGSQTLAARALRADGGLARAAACGAVIFGVCAGYQILGNSFCGADGKRVDGVGLLDIDSNRRAERAVGEVVASSSHGLSIPLMSGFENHIGGTLLGNDASPLASVLAGIGNGNGTEGAQCGRIIGTYLHGPVLARNPNLADLLLSWVTKNELSPIDDAWIDRLRRERLNSVHKCEGDAELGTPRKGYLCAGDR